MANTVSAAINEAIRQMKEEDVNFTLEADFQFSLAWKLKEILGEKTKIILEYPYRSNEEKRIKYIDIYVDAPNEVSFIELKYKTKSQQISRCGIGLTLKKQGAQDLGRLMFVQDIERLEKIKNPTTKKMNNYCLFLTNDKTYWKKASGKTIDKDFYLANGIIAGEKNFSSPTTKYQKVVSTNAYECHWSDYTKNFKLLMIKIKPSEKL